MALALALGGCARIGLAGSGPSHTVRFAIAADPQTLDPLFAHADASSVEQQLARLAFEPFIDVDAQGRPVPVLLDAHPDRRQRRSLARRPHDRLPPAARRALARRRPGDRARRALHACTRSSIRPQSGPFARRLRPDRARRAHRRRTPCASRCKAPWAPAVATLVQLRHRAAVRSARASARKDKRRSTAPRSATSRLATGRTTSSRGSAATISSTRRTRTIGAVRRSRSTSRSGSSPIPAPNYTALQSGALDWNLLSPVQEQGCRGRPSRFVTSRWR